MKKTGQLDFSSTMEVLKMFAGLIAFSFTVVIVGKILISMATGMQATSLIQNSDMLTFMLNYPKYFDWIPLLIYAVMLVGSTITARLTPFNMGWIAFLVPLYIIQAVAIMFVGNIITYIFNVPILSDSVSQMTITPLLFEYSLGLGILYMFIVFIALFSKE